MWRPRIPSLSRSHRASSTSQSPASRSRSVEKRSESSKRLSRADTYVPSADEIAENPLGLSVLYTPEQPPSVDIIFVHGLGGGSIKTWSCDGDATLCWPKYFLPLEPGLRTARILSFGYDASILSRTQTIADIVDFAKGLLAETKYAKGSAMESLEIGRCPILFVAHSMGGLVVKKAYLLGRNDPHYRDIIAKIRAIIFLSTPHRGSGLAKILNTILSLWLSPFTSKSFIKDLSRGSESLISINEEFRQVPLEIELFSFYETQKTSLGPFRKEMIVNRESSILGYPREHSVPLNADHHTVSKFKSKEDPNYRSVVSVLKTVLDSCLVDVNREQAVRLKSALQKIEKRFLISATFQEDLFAFQDRYTAGTCEQLPKGPHFQTWINNTTSASVLWMHGQPGCGKSMKSAYLISHLREKGHLCHFFFFKHDDSTKRSATAMLRSLAFQAAQELPAFRDTLLRFADSDQIHEKFDDRFFWRTVFTPYFLGDEFDRPLIWIIDAIDEADSPCAIVSLISKIPSSAPIRILLTGRQTPAISIALNRLGLKLPRNDINVDENSEDIRVHVEAEAAGLQGSSSFQKLLVSQIIQRAEGSFLWASLAVQECLRSHSQDDLQEVLNGIPTGMEALYRRMESSISSLTRASDLSLARKILTWTTYAKRPLSKDELLSILEPEFPSINDLSHSINQVCGHFAMIDRSDRICLVHQSAREYLTHTSNLPFDLDSRSANEEIFFTSLQDLLDPQLRLKIEKRKLSTFSYYAASSWAYHLDRLSAGSDKVLTELVGFLHGPSVLSWVEIVASSRSLKDLVMASTALSSFATRRKRRDLDANPLLHRLSNLKVVEMWAVDILKVAGKFGFHLLQEPSAIYQYIPQFCPSDSVIYKQFSSSFLNKLSISGLSALDWDDLLSRISMGASCQIRMVIVSRTHIGLSTSNLSVFIYDSVTFEQTGVLNHGERVNRICFSENGNLLASYGANTTKIWNSTTNALQNSILNASDGKALDLAFVDQDSALFLCTDLRETMKLVLGHEDPKWTTFGHDVFKNSEAVSGTFRNSPSAVKLSPDVTQLAIAYRGAPLEVWDLHDDKFFRRCRRKSHADRHLVQIWTGVNKVLWHPDNGEIIGIYTDGSVFKWYPPTESHLEVPNVSDIGPSEIAISPSGSVFALSDDRGCVRLFSYEDFVCLYQLTSEDNIMGLCFTPDSCRFVDIRGSHCNIWEPNALVRLYELDEKSFEASSEARSLSSVSFTASEARVEPLVTVTQITAKQPGPLVYYGNNEGAIILQDHRDQSRSELGSATNGVEITSLTLSRDGRYLVFEDLSGMITITIIKTTANLSKGPPKLDTILRVKPTLGTTGTRQVIMSQDSRLLFLAEASEGQVWNLETRTMSARHNFPTAGSRLWCNHPSQMNQMLVLKAEDITLCTWTAEGLSPKHKWKIQAKPPHNSNIVLSRPGLSLVRHGTNSSDTNLKAEDSDSKIDKIIYASDGSLLLLLYSNLTVRSKVQDSPRMQFIRTSDLDPSATMISPLSLPMAIASLIERPLTVLKGGMFVFIDTSFWICTWKLVFTDDPNTEDSSSWANSHDGGNGVPAEAGLRWKNPDEMAQLGVTRHYFLPRDWVDANSLALCTMLDDGTLLCPRKGEVAVIKSGLGSNW